MRKFAPSICSMLWTVLLSPTLATWRPTIGWLDVGFSSCETPLPLLHNKPQGTPGKSSRSYRSSCDETPKRSSPCHRPALDNTVDTFAPNHIVVSPMIPQPANLPTTTNYTPLPSFLNLADSPAACLLLEWDLRVFFSPAQILSPGKNTPSSSNHEPYSSDSASDQSTVSLASSASPEVSVPRKRQRFRS